MSRAAALLSCALSAGEQNNFVWFTPIILQQLDCPWVGVVLQQQQHVGYMGMIWCVHAQSVGPGGPSTAITCVQRQQVNWQKKSTGCRRLPHDALAVNTTCSWLQHAQLKHLETMDIAVGCKLRS